MGLSFAGSRFLLFIIISRTRSSRFEIYEQFIYPVNWVRFLAARALKANKLAIPLAIKKLESGKIVIFDGCFYHKTQIIHLTKNLPYRHFIFTLKASVGNCISRDKGRRSIGEKSIRAVHKLVSLDYGNVIIANKKTPEQTLQTIIPYLPTSSSN